MRLSEQAGFTLLEMLAALAVMAVCCSVLLVAFGQSARSLQHVARSDRLTLAARTLLDQEGAEGLQSGHREGVLNGGVHWQLTVRQQPTRAEQPRLFRLDLSVSEAHRQAHFSTLRIRGPSTGSSTESDL
jgi:general secretion pathway protein I